MEEAYNGNPEYRIAMALVEETARNLFLTGRAGTGKTTFLKELRERNTKRMVVLAPTGIAAIHAGGSTLHSFFQLPLGLYLPGYKRRNKFRIGKEKIALMQGMELMVIDEVSMLRPDLLDEVNGILQKYRHDKRPFGGVQLLLIGDVQQLAPVVTESEWEEMKACYASPWFFESMALKQAGFLTVELKKIYRQRDPGFIALLEKLRSGCLDSAALARLATRYKPGFKPGEDDGYVTLTTHNYQADRINNTNVEALPGSYHTYEAQVDGSFPENSFPTWKTLRFKPGAQVMFVKNDAGHRYYNGKIGKIRRCEESVVYVECEGEEIRVMPEIWNNVKYTIDAQTKEIKENVEGSFVQMPLKLAWAITIHKSQGLTFDKVVVDAGRAFAHGQVYVALSRCRSLEGLVLRSPVSEAALHGEEKVEEFLRGQPNCPDMASLERYKAEYHAKLLAEQFDFSALWKLLGSLRTFAQKSLKSYPRLCFDIGEAESRFESEVYRVGERFFKELCRIPDTEASYKMERCMKAARYFSDKVEGILRPLLPRLAVDLEPVASKIRLASLQSGLKRLYLEKERTLATLMEHGAFDGLAYLRAKSDA